MRVWQIRKLTENAQHGDDDGDTLCSRLRNCLRMSLSHSKILLHCQLLRNYKRHLKLTQGIFHNYVLITLVCTITPRQAMRIHSVISCRISLQAKSVCSWGRFLFLSSCQCDECFHSLFIETDNLLLLFWKCSLFTLKHFFFRNLNVWINNMAIKVGKLWKIIAYTFSTHNFLSIVLPYFLNVARQNSVYHITEQCRHTWQSAKSSMFDCIMTCLLKRKCSWAIEISTSFIDQMESGILLMFDHSKFTILETTTTLVSLGKE